MVTLNRLDGFEHGSIATGTAGPYSAVSGTPAIVTTPVRTGLRALEVTANAATEEVQYSITSTIMVSAFYLRFATIPSVTVKLARFLNANGSGYLRIASSGQLSIIAGAGAAVNLGSPLSTNTWYRIVLEYDTSTGTATLRGKVNNGTEATATNAQATASITATSFGTDAAVTYTAYFDDWIISITDADYEEISGTWTNHEVQSLMPSADGTHNITTLGDFDSFVGTAFSNATTTGWTFIDHRPLQLANTADQVIRQELGTVANYMEFTLENLTGVLIPIDVWCYGTHVESATTGASLGEMQLLLSDNTEVLTTGSLSMINSTEDPGITVTLRKRMAIRPSGGWDSTKINGLKVRLGLADNAPDVNFIDCLVEVALFEAPPSAVTNALQIVGGKGMIEAIYPTATG